MSTAPLMVLNTILELVVNSQIYHGFINNFGIQLICEFTYIWKERCWLNSAQYFFSFANKYSDL